jgi:hypothetical protein
MGTCSSTTNPHKHKANPLTKSNSNILTHQHKKVASSPAYSISNYNTGPK